MHELLKKYPVVVATPVAWGHMDAFQHVNNVMYFRYFENVRVLYGEKIGIVDRMESHGIGPILAHTECRFVRPMTYPDTALCGARTISVQGSEMTLKYKLVSEKQNAVAAVGTSMGVYYDYRNLKRVDFPQELIDRIRELEGRDILSPDGNS